MLSSMAEEAARMLASAVRRVAVNRVVRSGERWIKRRVAGSAMVVATGNTYLRRAGGFVMIASALRWARHEVAVYRSLYGASAAGLVGDDSVWMAHTPGETLSSVVQRGHALHALHAAGVELRRVHHITIDGRAFSHGDLHLANILFCPEEERARLIDFETVHLDEHSARARHADDLACLAFDLAATSPRPAEDWSALLRGYALDDALRPALAAKLVVCEDLVPRSLQLLRTRHLHREQLALRLRALRRELVA